MDISPHSFSGSRYGLCASGLIAALLLAWFYHWSPSSFPARLLTEEPVGLYNEMTEALLAGQLSLLDEPDPRLIALDDPYDPAANAPFRRNDVSYRDGRYYLYYGIAPAISFHLPIRLLTGRYPAESTATLVYCLGTALLSVSVLLALRRRAFPGASPIVLVSGVIALCLANGYQAVLRHPSANHVAIAAAACFAMLALTLLFKAMAHRTAPSLPWLAAAGLAFSLAMASRPNYLFGAAALLVPLFPWHARAPATSIRIALATVLPCALVAAALLALNAIRFGSPGEFGMRLMLGAWDQRELPDSGLAQVTSNAWHYLASPPDWSPYFPFARSPTWLATGIFMHVPLLWFLPTAWLSLRARGARSITAAAALLGIGILFYLLILPSGNNEAVLASANSRYVFDFQPALMLLAAVGILAASQALNRRPLLQGAVSAAAGLACAASVVLTLSLDFQKLPTNSYRPLARVLNLPPHILEGWAGQQFGPVEMEVTFPETGPGIVEPLLAVGDDRGGDVLLIRYEGNGRARLSLASQGSFGATGEPFDLRPGIARSAFISMGSLLPPEGHPMIDGLDEPDAAYLRRLARVTIDGEIVFEARSSFFAPAAAPVVAGRNPVLPDYGSPEFTGSMRQTGRAPVTAPFRTTQLLDGYGPLALAVVFPATPTGQNEPLIVSGVPQAGDFVVARIGQDQTVRIGIDHWGTQLVMGEPVPFIPGTTTRIEIHLGSLFPPRGHVLFADWDRDAIDRAKDHVRILLDGRTVLDRRLSTYESSPYDVTVGVNAIGGSTTAPVFSGQILGVDRLPMAPNGAP
jgi:hypothetical protein